MYYTRVRESSSAFPMPPTRHLTPPLSSEGRVRLLAGLPDPVLFVSAAQGEIACIFSDTVLPSIVTCSRPTHALRVGSVYGNDSLPNPSSLWHESFSLLFHTTHLTHDGRFLYETVHERCKPFECASCSTCSLSTIAHLSMAHGLTAPTHATFSFSRPPRNFPKMDLTTPPFFSYLKIPTVRNDGAVYSCNCETRSRYF